MSDSQRNILLSLCGVAVVCMVAGFLLGRIATKPAPADPYSVYSHSSGTVLRLVRHNKQTGKTEYTSVYLSVRDGKLRTPEAWKPIPE